MEFVNFFQSQRLFARHKRITRWNQPAAYISPLRVPTLFIAAGLSQGVCQGAVRTGRPTVRQTEWGQCGRTDLCPPRRQDRQGPGEPPLLLEL